MIEIPEKAIHQHTVVLGKTRSGKSSTLRVLIEYLLDQHKPVCILDPKGDWWGLKSSADGKRAAANCARKRGYSRFGSPREHTVTTNMHEEN